MGSLFLFQTQTERILVGLPESMFDNGENNGEPILYPIYYPNRYPNTKISVWYEVVLYRIDGCFGKTYNTRSEGMDLFASRVYNIILYQANLHSAPKPLYIKAFRALRECFYPNRTPTVTDVKPCWQADSSRRLDRLSFLQRHLCTGLR